MMFFRSKYSEITNIVEQCHISHVNIHEFSDSIIKLRAAALMLISYGIVEAERNKHDNMAR